MKKYLIMCTSSLGDVALSLRLVYSIAREYPKANFVYMMKSSITDILVGAPDNLEAYSISFSDGDRSIYSMYSLLRKLRRENFDNIIDLRPTRRTFFIRNFLRLFSQTKSVTAKINLNRKDAKLLKKRERISIDAVKDAEESFIKAFDKIGLCTKKTYPPINPSDYLKLDPSLKENFPKGDFFIAYAPFSRKEMPNEAILNTVNLFLNKVISSYPDAGIFLFGKKSALENTFSKDERYTIIPDDSHFYQEMYSISQCKLILTTDSTFSHIAYLLGVPIKILPTTPYTDTTIKDILENIKQMLEAQL